MSNNLVIVESPAKSKTIKKFLGKTYTIEASMGHVRDLPKSQLGVDIENDFEPKYITIRGKGELLAKLRKEAKVADRIYLATDPDREGEAISWHLIYALGLDPSKTSRITFNEITKNAVKKSIKEARDIDMNLVDAQQARRILDRIVGYSISPLLWKNVKKGLSAGRVQSVALRMICDREEEISNFIPEEYWTISADIKRSGRSTFKADFYGDKNGKIELKTEGDTKKIVDTGKKYGFTVSDIKEGTRTKKPQPPFTTSTLQQEASKLLNMTTQRTMLIAQQLYEGVDIKGEGTVGLVSYIRTDSTRISDEAYNDANEFIVSEFGKEYLPPQRNVYKSRNNAQDAHEAIRPTMSKRTPSSVKDSLSRDQYRLYKLIWERFLASQMANAMYKTKTIKLSTKDYIFKTSGSTIDFKGFTIVYESSEDDERVKIPELKVGDKLEPLEINPIQHFTQAPPRYTDASLVKTLEEIGVGRPSTYAPTISIILARNYVVKEAKQFYTTELGEAVNDIMKEYFKNIVDSDFTAQMEERLDLVETGDIKWKEAIREFYPSFSDELNNAQEHLSKIEIKDEETDVICEKCGRNMVIKYGRYGKFLACPGFPDCQNIKPYFEESGANCPKCNGRVFIKKTKKGRKYYGCENNPQCDYMSWNKPTNEKCPQCGEHLEERGSKNPKLVCSNEKCGYFRELEEKPE